MVSGGIGTKWVHSICGTGGLFKSEAEAIDCANNNMVYMGSVAFLTAFLCAILFAVASNATGNPLQPSTAAICGFVIGGIVGWAYAPSMPFGPVGQYRTDERDVQDRMTRGMDRGAAEADVILDRQREQLVYNSSRYSSSRRGGVWPTISIF